MGDKAAMILVTGSSGFIGAHLVKKLVGLEETVIGCDLVIPHFSHEKFKNFTYDFTSPRLEHLFKAYNFECCYHLGAIANLNYAREHLHETVKVNVLGTANLVRFCDKYDVPLNYMSTCCVYGNTTEHPTTEEAPTRPTEIYGCTKLAGEQILRGYHHLTGLKHNIIRSSTVYGPGMRSALAIYIFLDKALKNQPIPIHGTGKQTRTFIYIKDLIDGVVKLRNKFFNSPTNFAGKETLSVLQITKKCLQLTKTKSKLTFMKDRPGQVMCENISSSKAEHLLSWKPKTRIDSGLQLTLKSLKLKP